MYQKLGKDPRLKTTFPIPMLKPVNQWCCGSGPIFTGSGSGFDHSDPDLVPLHSEK